jgi:hypothetical protein
LDFALALNVALPPTVPLILDSALVELTTNAVCMLITRSHSLKSASSLKMVIMTTLTEMAFVRAPRSVRLPVGILPKDFALEPQLIFNAADPKHLF